MEHSYKNLKSSHSTSVQDGQKNVVEKCRSFKLGENGESTISIILILVMISYFAMGFFYLAKKYNYKTEETINEFQKDWNKLQIRYKEQKIRF